MKKTLFTGLSAENLKKRKKTEEPSLIPLMLATLTKEYFSRNDWLYEHKFDGERCLAIKKKGDVYLVSRNQKSMNKEYPELVEALLKQKADNFIIDGEITSNNKAGVSDFQLLQGQDGGKSKYIPIQYCIFDLMYVEGYDIRALPLYVRKGLLK